MADHFYAINKGQTVTNVVVGTASAANAGIELRIRDGVPLTKADVLTLTKWLKSYITVNNALA